MIVEVCFCDNKHDIDLYKAIGVNGIAEMIVKSIDGKSAPISPEQNPQESIPTTAPSNHLLKNRK